MTKKQLKKLRKSLHKGDISSISAVTGYSKSYITKVFYGTYYNQKIIDEALKIAKKYDQVKKYQSQKIDALC